MLLTFLVELVIFTVVSASCVFNDGAVWYHYAGHCYFASGPHDERNYDDADRSCWHLDSYLLSVTSWQEERFVVNHLIGEALLYTVFWIGLRKAFPSWEIKPDINERRAGWSWHSGEIYNRQNWFDGDSILEAEPNTFSGYVGVYPSGFWTDVSPYGKYRYICERKDDGTETTYFPVSTTSINNAETDWHITSFGQTFSTYSAGRLPITPEPSQEPVSTPTSRSNGGNGGITGEDNHKYMYIGVVLGVTLFAVIAGVAFVILWRRRTSKSQGVPELQNVTRQGHTDDTTNDSATRGENDYVELRGCTQKPGRNYSAVHSLPQNSSPSTSNDMYAEVGRAGRMLSSPDIPAGDGGPSVLYAVPHRGGPDDDDDEVTIVENTAYSSYLSDALDFYAYFYE